MSRTLSSALNITVPTVIAGQVKPIRTTVRHRAFVLSQALAAVDAGAGCRLALTATVDARTVLEILGVGACDVKRGAGTYTSGQNGGHGTSWQWQAQWSRKGSRSIEPPSKNLTPLHR